MVSAAQEIKLKPRSPRRTTRLAVVVPPDLAERLRETAHEAGLSVNEVVNQAIELVTAPPSPPSAA